MKRLFLIAAFLLLAASAWGMPYDYYLGTEDEPDFYVPLLVNTTAVKCGTAGGCTPTFTRPSTAFFPDFEGLFKEVQSGVIRFEGANHVRNLYTNSAALTTQNVTTIAGTYLASCYGTGSITFSGTATGTLNCTAGRASSSLTTTAGTLTSTVSGTVTNAQLENRTGASNTTTPMEYVDSATSYGAGANGVRYFNVDYTGAAIADETLKGYLAEGARTTYATWTNDLTNVAWTKTNMTTAFTSTGPAGVPNNATRLTASAANATATQSITRASTQRVTGVFLKRITGTGTINITQDNGSTWTPVTITSSWALYQLPAATLANPIIGIQIVTSGDAVDATWWQHEEAAFISSPIPNNSATASVTRNADVLTYPSANNVDGTKGAVFATVQHPSYIDDNMTYYRIIGRTNTGEGELALSSGADKITFYDGTAWRTGSGTYTFTVNRRKLGWKWGTVTKGFVDGVDNGAVTFDGDMGFGSNFRIGSEVAGSSLFGTIRDVKIYRKALSDSFMQRNTQ